MSDYIKNEYIYIRMNEWWDIYDAIKMGKAKNAIDRESTYNTSEIKRGTYILVLKVNDCHKIEKKLKKHFKEYNIIFDGGIEFFKKAIIDMICPYLDKKGYDYYKLSQEEIELLNRTERDNKDYDSETSETSSIIETQINLYPWQKDLVVEFRKFIDSSNPSGIIIAPTGCGKSFMMNYLAIFEYIEKNDCDVMIMTKRKEILDNEFIKKGKEMKENIKFINIIDSEYDNIIFSKSCKKNRIFIINTDKFIASNRFNDYKKISYGKIKLVMLDECHWSGADKLSDFLCYIKDNVCHKLVGFSATPVRFHSENIINTKKVFSDNIIYTRSYLESIKDNDRVMTKWLIIPISTKELCNDKHSVDRMLNKKGFASFIVWLNNFISDSLHKKGILWFANKKNLNDFYEYVIKEKDTCNNLKNINFIPTFSKSADDIIDTTGNLEIFKKHNINAILLAVYRATEGFNDIFVDFGFNLYTTKNTNPLLDQQKEGRVSRNCPNKKIGYFGFLSNNDDDYVDVLVKRLGDWLSYIKEFDIIMNKTTKKKSSHETNIYNYLDIILDSNNIKTINLDSIKNKIFNYCEQFTGSINDVKRIVQKENKQRIILNQELIDTKEKYDIYAQTKENWPISNTMDINNWVALLRPDFDTFKNNFMSLEQLKKYININKISNMKQFKDNITHNSKIPLYEYIHDGFYNTPTKTINITSLLYQNNDEYEV